MKALFYMHVFASGSRQLYSLLYPVRQLHHVCRVNAEEDVQDFSQLRTGIDPPQVVGILLTSPKFSAIAWSGTPKFLNSDMHSFCDPSKFRFLFSIGGILFLHIRDTNCLTHW